MADKLTLLAYAAMSASAKSSTNNDDLLALAKDEGVDVADGANKSNMITALDAKVAASPDTTAPADPNATQADGAGWGTPPASGNGAHLADTLPPADAVGGTPVENDGPGQGRVMAPNADVHPADTVPGAAPQAEPNTPDHHDASAEGQGPGGTTLDPEVAKATGAALADPDARAPEGPSLTDDLANRSNAFDPSHKGGEGDDVPEGLGFIVSDNNISHMDLLRASLETSANIAAQKAQPVNPNYIAPTLPDGPAGFDIEPGVNEKLTDAIGSTHDAGGNEVAKGASGPGLPVYVGTAQPVEQPDAQWRANSGV